MTDQERAAEFWFRATRALAGARLLRDADSNGAASRAYYAAFQAVSALFALDGRRFSKHSAVQAAVHRDLVRPGRWSQELGADYTYLRDWRDVGDCSVEERVSAEDAQKSISKAQGILKAVQEERPDVFAEAPDS